MLAYLKGNFVHKTPTKLVVDVNGVGYEVEISLNTYDQLRNLENGLLHVVFIVREDAHLVYGFFTTEEKEMFMHLKSVSGVGANTARVMLSYVQANDLAATIASGNAALLEKIKGIGKKTAERIILELKEKLLKWKTGANILPVQSNTLAGEALEALLALGISRPAAETALKKCNVVENEDVVLQDLIKMALKNL